MLSFVLFSSCAQQRNRASEPQNEPGGSSSSQDESQEDTQKDDQEEGSPSVPLSPRAQAEKEAKQKKEQENIKWGDLDEEIKAKISTLSFKVKSNDKDFDPKKEKVVEHLLLPKPWREGIEFGWALPQSPYLKLSDDKTTLELIETPSVEGTTVTLFLQTITEDDDIFILDNPSASWIFKLN